MNVEIGADAVLFPEKEYISWIFVAMQCREYFWNFRIPWNLPLLIREKNP
jgi:hypothetical protein